MTEQPTSPAPSLDTPAAAPGTKQPWHAPTLSRLDTASAEQGPSPIGADGFFGSGS